VPQFLSLSLTCARHAVYFETPAGELSKSERSAIIVRFGEKAVLASLRRAIVAHRATVEAEATTKKAKRAKKDKSAKKGSKKRKNGAANEL
jgi:hypothetical protein